MQTSPPPFVFALPDEKVRTRTRSCPALVTIGEVASADLCDPFSEHPQLCVSSQSCCARGTRRAAAAPTLTPLSCRVSSGHFILRGPPDSPYEGGEYYGQPKSDFGRVHRTLASRADLQPSTRLALFPLARAQESSCSRETTLSSLRSTLELSRSPLARAAELTSPAPHRCAPPRLPSPSSSIKMVTPSGRFQPERKSQYFLDSVGRRSST